MSLTQLARNLRKARSEMPRRTSAEAYAQMDKLMGQKKPSMTAKNSGARSVRGQKGSD